MAEAKKKTTTTATTKKVATAAVEKSNDNSKAIEELKQKYTKEIESLKQENEKQISQYQSMIDELRNMIQSGGMVRQNAQDNNPTRLVEVVSLLPYKLVLTNSNGRRWEFPEFGSKHKIGALDVVDICTSTGNEFATKGYFYVCDEALVEEMGFTDIYSNMLSYDVIKNLLVMDDKEFKNLCTNSNNDRFESLFRHFIKKMQEFKEIPEKYLSKARTLEREYNNRHEGVDFRIEDYINDLVDFTPNSQK